MKKKILVVNEDKCMAALIQQSLTSPTTEVILVFSMQEALQLFKQDEYCLVILDSAISMEDNFYLLKLMRNARYLPLLVLSSHPEHPKRLEFLQAGAHAYIGQPFSLEECLLQAQSLMQLYIASHPTNIRRYSSGACPGIQEVGIGI